MQNLLTYCIDLLTYSTYSHLVLSVGKLCKVDLKKTLLNYGSFSPGE
jgi:hypothetical protein